MLSLRLCTHTACTRLSVAALSGTRNIGDHSKDKQPSTAPVFTNRNPRNLEYLGLAKKQKGWDFQYPSKEFYHRVTLDCTLRHTTGKVEHSSGQVILFASTKEQSVAKQLKSSSDLRAAENIGRILADRCQQCGLTHMTFFQAEGSEKSVKVDAFRKAMQAGGISFDETEEIIAEEILGLPYEDCDYMAELKERQRKAEPQKFGDPRWDSHLAVHPKIRTDDV